jgi:hypothetical protein
MMLRKLGCQDGKVLFFFLGEIEIVSPLQEQLNLLSSLCNGIKLSTLCALEILWSELQFG